MQNQSELKDELQEMFSVVYDRKLYLALPEGKVGKLTKIMNETMNPPKKRVTYHKWFSNPVSVPKSDIAATLATMQDALFEVAEETKFDMKEKVLSLHREAAKLEMDAEAIEQQVKKAINQTK